MEIKRKIEILTKSQGLPSVVQWLKICLPMQGTQVQSLVWEDSGAKSWSKACVPQLLSLCSRAHALQQDKPPEQDPSNSHRSRAPGSAERLNPSSEPLYLQNTESELRAPVLPKHRVWVWNPVSDQ